MEHKSLGRDDIPEFVFSFCLIKSVAANIEARELRLPSGKFEVNFPKYYDRHNELVNRHEMSVLQMTTGMFHLSKSQLGSSRL